MTEQLSRYYVYIKKSIRGPFYPQDVAQQPGFGRSSLVCPEKSLGQWREAYLEPAFQAMIEMPPGAPQKPRPPMTVEAAEETAARSLLEKAITKNSQLEREVKDLRKSYHAEKHHFDETLKRKETEIHALTDKLKRSNENAQAARGEHPSWETLYKTLKKRAEDKLAEATQALAEKTGEISHLRERLMAAAEGSSAALKKTERAAEEKIEELKDQIDELKSQVEEKDMLARTLADNIASLAGKNEEFQKIMFDERRDYEAQAKKFCDEIGALRADLKWRDQEAAKMRDELFDAMQKIKEFEAVDEIKSREQEELYDVMSAKLKLLSGYFENLEARVKYAFKKA